MIVSVPTKRGPEFVGFLAEGDSPPFRIAGRECMHDFGADAPSPKPRRHLDELDQGCGRAKPRSAFVMVDVHGVIKIDTCNVDTVTENLYIPRVVDQAGRIVTPARGEVVARLEWPPGIPVLCAPSLLIKFQGQILARPPYIRPRPSRMAANGSTKTLARQPLRAWVHEYSSRRAPRRGKRQPSPRARIYGSAGRITGHGGGMQ